MLNTIFVGASSTVPVSSWYMVDMVTQIARQFINIIMSLMKMASLERRYIVKHG